MVSVFRAHGCRHALEPGALTLRYRNRRSLRSLYAPRDAVARHDLTVTQRAPVAHAELVVILAIMNSIQLDIATTSIQLPIMIIIYVNNHITHHSPNRRHRLRKVIIG